MPRGYEKMRDKFISQGMTVRAAKKKAARIWNAKHPDNPVYPHREKKRRRKK